MTGIVYEIIVAAFRIYYLLIFIRIIMSWIGFGDNFVTRFIYDMTEPILGIFRRIFPPRPSFPVDLSPIFAYVALRIIESIILRIILYI